MIVTAFDGSTKEILKPVLIDVVIFIAVQIFALYGEVATPIKRGFFCDDESLMHPYHGSTVKEVWLFVMIGMPLVLIALVEVIRWKLDLDEKRDMKIFGFDIPNYLQNLYRFGGIYLFGDVANALITDWSKVIVGRYRPHFLPVCQPILPDGTNCTNPMNMYKFIEDFTCGNLNATAEQLDQVGRSFPSGHSSIAFFTLIFAAIYLHYRMTWKGSRLAKHLLQLVFLMTAMGVSLSRIPDNKHHWSDVLAGALLGLIMCLITVKVSDLKNDNDDEEVIPITQRRSSEMIPA